MSSHDTKSGYIAQDEGICGGQPRIDGTRLKVQQIILEYAKLGWTPDQICDSHPGITLAQVHSAISYYYDHMQEIDEAIRKDGEFVERIKSGIG